MRQADLFIPSRSAAEPTVPGFTLRENYIDATEERSLLEHVSNEPWDTDWRRRVQRYGVGYGRGEARDFPAWLIPLAQRVARDANFPRFPENCVINEYRPRQGIAPHKDYGQFGPTIACVSLGSDVVLDFIRSDRKVRVPMHVPARSLWVIEGEARSKWLHGIAPRVSDVINGERRMRARRVSITFRTAEEPSALARRIKT
jgi:alkylated DNA repair dioxygenase AlkB